MDGKTNYSYMNSFGSLNEVKELPPFTLDRAANSALEIIHGEQSNTHMDTQSNIQYTAEQYMDSRALYNIHEEQIKGRLRMSQVNLR